MNNLLNAILDSNGYDDCAFVPMDFGNNATLCAVVFPEHECDVFEKPVAILVNELLDYDEEFKAKVWKGISHDDEGEFRAELEGMGGDIHDAVLLNILLHCDYGHINPKDVFLYSVDDLHSLSCWKLAPLIPSRFSTAKKYLELDSEPVLQEA